MRREFSGLVYRVLGEVSQQAILRPLGPPGLLDVEGWGSPVSLTSEALGGLHLLRCRAPLWGFGLRGLFCQSTPFLEHSHTTC